MQLNLPFTCKPIYTLDNWFIEKHNQEATRTLLDHLFPFLWLYGDKGIGKTHLSNLWAKKHGGVFLTDTSYRLPKNSKIVVDDVDTYEDEDFLFHFYNDSIDTKSFVLFTARAQPAHMPIRLLDLSSRFKTIPLVHLEKPCDDDLKQILIRQLKNRGITIQNRHASYIINRIERSMQSLRHWIHIIETIQNPLSFSILKEIGIA